jgi:glycerophosphoryl diester phosphodiesterase
MEKFSAVFFVLIFCFSGILFPQDNKVEITAHRGASGHAPENTIASVKEAINMKAQFAEIDVQETSDGEIILLHDGSLNRTTGFDKNIWEASYADVKKLDAGSWFSEKYKGEPVPLFSSLLDSVKGKIGLNIELKTNGHEQKLADRAVKILKDKKCDKSCYFTSFSYNQVKRVKEIDPEIKTGLIFSSYPAEFDVFTGNFEILSVGYNLVDADFVKKAKENHKEIHVWTVDDEKEMQRLIDLGVTSIITNYPDRLQKLLDKSN